MNILENKNNYKILTSEGYKHFSGIRRSRKSIFNLECDTCSLSATQDHRFMSTDGNFKMLKDLKLGDTLITKNGVTSIKKIEKLHKAYVYDLINVEEVESYYTNGILTHNCEFISSGESSVNDELFEKLTSKTSEPLFVFDDGKYLLWDEPKEDRIYVASVDTSEGLGKDASVIQILDYTDLTNINQVAVYHNNEISPYNFTEKVYEVLQHWGNPLVCIERNNSGGQVADILKNTHDYENIVSWGGSLASRKKQQLGIISHTNTKYKGVANMRYWINELESVQINDKRTVKELKNYVKAPNGTWNAKKGYHDDLVTSLMWNLIILVEDIVETYFEVIKKDTNNRPLELQQMDFGIKYFMNPTSLYTNEKEGLSNTLPVIIGNASNTNSEIDQLQMQGYKVWGP